MVCDAMHNDDVDKAPTLVGMPTDEYRANASDENVTDDTRACLATIRDTEYGARL